MDGYNQLKTRATIFLRNNPDVQAVTLVRPKRRKQRKVYENGNAECYGRVPETCDSVARILRQHLPDSLKIMRGREKVDVEELRDAIFQEIRREITLRFREHFEAVCDHKHALLDAISTALRGLEEARDDAETPLPVDPAEESSADEVQVEVAD